MFRYNIGFIFNKTIVEDGVGEYKKLLDNTALKNATDKYWINALELYEKLTSEETFEFDVMISGISTENELQDTFLGFVEDNIN